MKTTSARRAWRRTAAPARVAVARLRSRPGRNALLLAGIAASAAMLVVVLGATVVARDLSLRRLVRDLPADEQSFRVDVVGLPKLARDERPGVSARQALREVTPAAPIHVIAFRDFWLQNELIRLGGIDGHRDELRLVSGRFPSRCDPQVCEVLQIGDRGNPELSQGEIHLRRVGIAELAHPAAFGPAFSKLRRVRAQASVRTSVLLLGPSAAALERQPALELLFRLASWVVPLDAARLHAWQVRGLVRREARAQAILTQADPTFLLVGPDTAFVEATDRGSAYGKRMALIGASIAVALFGFALVAAAGLRRGIAGERRRLAQRGATRSQLFVASLTEVGAIALAGWLVGIVVGAIALAAISSAKGLPAGAIVEHALWTRDALLVFLCGFVVAVAVLLAVSTGEEPTARRPRVRVLDVVALGALLAVAVGLSRGALHAGSGTEGDTTFLLLLPALVCIAGGLIAARLLGPLMRLAERAARRASVSIRLALLALARAPARTAAAGAFLVVTVSLTVFAAAYAATLERGARDEAAFAVPLDVTVTSGGSLVQPLDAASVSRYERVANGVRAFPALRTTAEAGRAGTDAASPTVLGVAPDALARMRWRGDYANRSHAAIVRAITPDRDVSLRSVAIPAGTMAVSMRTQLRGEPLSLALVLRDKRGRISRAPLGIARAGSSTLTARLRPGAVAVLGLEIALTPAGRAWLLHLYNEGRLVRAPSGVVSLGRLTTADGDAITNWGDWVARGQTATIRGRYATRLRVAYAFEEAETLRLRPRQPTDGYALPVLASPGVAAAAGPGGLVTLDYLTNQVEGRVVAVARRFPTMGEDEQFAVVDEDALQTALTADAPGTGTPGEVWLSVPASQLDRTRLAFARRPFAQLERTSRETLYRQAHDDPLARGVAAVLGAAALAAILLAVVGLWATVLSDLRDERDTFFDLEVQGASPATLRAHLRLRALCLLAFGVVGGAILGFLLSRLVASVVQVTGGATDPFPPLVLDWGARSVAAALALLVVLSVVVVEATVRGAFRAEAPERTSWSFE